MIPFLSLVPSGGLFFERQRIAPQAPQETARGREFRLSLPLDPHSQRPKKGPCGGPSLETPLGCSDDRLFTPTAYFVTPWGFGRFSVDVPCSCPQGPKDEGQGPGVYNGRNHRFSIRGIALQRWRSVRLYRSSYIFPLVLCP